MSATRWRRGDLSDMPLGESVLCWDAVNRVMFIAYRSGADDLVAVPENRRTDCSADWWRPLPSEPK